MVAELVGANFAGRDLVHKRIVLQELNFPQTEPATLYLDNQAALKVSKEAEHQGRVKHMDLKWFWIRDAVEKKELRVEYVPTNQQVADIFTKPLSKIKHFHFCRLLGMTSIKSKA
jgi:hypothetical protein